MKKLLALGLMLMVCGIAQAAIIETATIFCDADAGNGGLDSASRTYTFGNTSSMNFYTNKWRKNYVHFDMSSLAGATITNVSIQFEISWVQAPSTNSYPVNAYVATSEWDELSLNWTYRKSGVAWNTVGGDYGAQVATGLIGNTTGLKTLTGGAELIALVQGWVDGTVSNYGIMMMNDTLGGGEQRAMRVRELTPGQQARLVVEYTIPEPATLGLLASGVAFMLKRKK
jgi:hypothetical protein